MGSSRGESFGNCADRIPMKMQPHGAQAETRVSSLLQRQGWQLLDRNWSCRWGELDLVLHKNMQLLVVEVIVEVVR